MGQQGFRIGAYRVLSRLGAGGMGEIWLAAKDGAIVWDFDTAQSWDGVNGVKVKGGAMDMGGQVIADGMLLVNSGVTPIQHPGNALLVFTVDGK